MGGQHIRSVYAPPVQWRNVRLESLYAPPDGKRLPPTCDVDEGRATSPESGLPGRGEPRSLAEVIDHRDELVHCRREQITALALSLV
jgi:hypothetical protein